MKIFYILFFFFITFSSTLAINEVKIISRSDWGANENYRYINGVEWKNIMTKREEKSKIVDDTIYTQEQVDTYKLREKQLKEMDSILINDFAKYIEIQDKKIFSENGNALAWPITKAKKINGIVIHHTYSNYNNSLEGVRQIYKYHALTRQWGDIGYNFLIGKDGKIYEGRAGGDYAVAAHDKYNNIGNIGIALMGDYTEKPINIKQYNALKGLVINLVEKYNLDLTDKSYFHQSCTNNDCDKVLKSELKGPIVGHRDAGHTACPGDKLYNQIAKLNRDLLKEPASVANLYKRKVFKTLSKFPDEKLIDILAKIEDSLDKKKNSNKLKLKGLIIDYFKDKSSHSYVVSNNIDSKINIKLSYPSHDNIIIKSGELELDVKRRGNNVYVNGKKHGVLKVPKNNKDTILEISSWNRKPAWDTSGKYNDNKFRGDLIVYVKNKKLVVVNRLKIEDYLKGLGEVSNFENPEKIKTIIIAARSYATWYTTKARKFPGELYDGVDNPNVFQKYLGYGLEERSPIINEMVDLTKGKLITYNGELIKPWYFSNSNGNTLSFYDYCTIRYSDEICSEQAKQYPYLKSVLDKGSSGKIKAGHGVGISGSGVSYFVKKGWMYDMIIKYFLKGVDVL